MAKGNPIKKDLQQLLVRDFIDGKTECELITIKEDNTVEQAVNLLSENKILSAPVINKEGECTGFVDMLDIVWFVVSVAPEPSMLTEEDLKTKNLEMAGRAMSLAAVKEIMVRFTMNNNNFTLL